MAGSLTSSHRTRKILWDGPYPGNKVNSRGRCVENDILLLQRWHPRRREGWVTPWTPGPRQRLVLRGERLWMRRRASSVPWGPKSSSPDRGLQASVSPLRIHKISKIFMFFSLGCFFLTFSTPALWLIQTPVYLQTRADTVSLPWVNHTHWEFRKQSKGSD